MQEQPSEPTPEIQEKLFSSNFSLTTTANFFNTFGSQMMNTTLPVYVLSIGGNNVQAGLIGGILAITALLFRSPVGWLADSWKRRPLALIGSSFYGLASIIYAASQSIGGLMFGRIAHGLGISSYTTASNAYIMDISPPKHKAEAIGIFAATTSLGQIVGPAVGFWIISGLGFHWLFRISLLLSAITIAISYFAREQPKDVNKPRIIWSPKTSLLAIKALPVALVSLCLGLSTGAVNNFIAIFAHSRGINNPGFYFTVQAIALLLARVFSGRLADKYGHAAVIIPGVAAMSLALAKLPSAQTLLGLLVSAALFGLGFGMAQPANMALLADQVRPEQLGLGMATYFMGYDGGIFLGSIGFGIASETWGFTSMWYLWAIFPLTALLGLFLVRKQKAANAMQHLV